MVNSVADSQVATASGPEEKHLTSDQIKVLGLSGVGGVIELYEFIIFIMLTPFISQAFFPASSPEWLRTLQTLGIFALGYIVRPAGGVFIAVLGDLLGRKRMFAFTIMLMAVPTLLIGLLPTYAQVGAIAPVLLLICRLAQGLALGGEIPGAAVFVAEHVPHRRLGVSCSLIGSALALGIVIGAVVVGLLISTLGPQAMGSYGWRIAFIGGGIAGLFAGYLRRYVRETPVFQAMQKERKLASRVSFGRLFTETPVQLIAGLAVSFMAAAIPPMILLYPPIYMRTALKFDPGAVQGAVTWGTIAMVIGSVVGGWLTDKIGPIRTFVLFAIGLVASTFWLFISIQSGPQNLSLLFILAGFFGGIAGLGYFFLVQAFSPEVRFTGVSLPYNVSSALGGLIPVAMAIMMQSNPTLPGYTMAVLAVLATIGAWALWTRRRPISQMRD